MKSLPSKDRGTKNIIFYVMAVFISACSFYFWYVPITSFAFNIGVGITAPFWGAQDYISDKITSLLISFNNKEELIKKNEYLTKQIESFKYSTLENSLVRQENKELKKILGRVDDAVQIASSKKVDDKKILAYVLSGPVTPPYDTVILDAGSKLGVGMGDIVVGGDGYFMGEIIEVTTNYSKARLLSAYGLKTSVLLGSNKTMIDMTGMGGGNFFIAMPNDFRVKESELALLPGPELRRIAVVSRIEGRQGEMFKNVFLNVPFNIKEIGSVGIIKKIN